MVAVKQRIVHMFMTDLQLHNDEIRKPIQDEPVAVTAVKATNHPTVQVVPVVVVEVEANLQGNQQVGVQVTRNTIGTRDAEDQHPGVMVREKKHIPVEEEVFTAAALDLENHHVQVIDRVNRHQKIRSGAAFTLKDIANGEIRRVNSLIPMSVGDGELETARNRVLKICSIKNHRSNMHLQQWHNTRMIMLRRLRKRWRRRRRRTIDQNRNRANRVLHRSNIRGLR